MKKILRYFLISLFFLSLIGITTPLIVWNLNNRNPDPTALIITGDVSQETTFTYEDIIAGEYGLVENHTFTFRNQFYPESEQYEVNYTGVSVWALLTHTNIINPSASKIYFKSWDAYNTAGISLEDVENNPENIIIAFKMYNRMLENNTNDGGPLRAIVNLSVTLSFDPPTYSSQYWAKYVNEIVVE